MAWDIALDPETGDFAWNGSLDLAAVVGDAILRQQISTRIKVEYGSFVHAPNLGSRLRSVLGMGVPRTDQNIQMLVQDALEPMDDITILGIDIIRPDSRTIQVSINYQQANNPSSLDSLTTPQAQTTILIPG